MDDHPYNSDVIPTVDEATHPARVESERAMIAEGTAQLDRGEFYDWDVIKTWMKALAHDPDAKLPPLMPRP